MRYGTAHGVDEVVLSVDGVNAVSGETANWGQTGYVLGSRVQAQVTAAGRNRQFERRYDLTERVLPAKLEATGRYKVHMTRDTDEFIVPDPDRWAGLREYIERLLTGRDEAKEIRAFGLSDTLRRRVSARLTV